MRVSRISSTSSGSYAQSVTSCPFFATRSASVVPQLPAPITPIRSMKPSAKQCPIPQGYTQIDGLNILHPPHPRRFRAQTISVLVFVSFVPQVVPLRQRLGRRVETLQRQPPEEGVDVVG